jgi:murein DD-endopeptidase MepM/ murein hydrolase activator NlpD
VDPRSLSAAEYCSRFVEEVHQKHGLDASFGGYLEDRAFLWQGTYLGGTERALHLGIDFNVPAGCAVATPFDGTVVAIDDDTPERFGWGPRVFIERYERGETGERERYVYIFAHLAEVQVIPGDHLKAGHRIAKIGAPPNNGNWYPHLHLQKVQGAVFDRYRSTDIWKLDGYGVRSEVDVLEREFPEPLSMFVDSSGS